MVSKPPQGMAPLWHPGPARFAGPLTTRPRFYSLSVRTWDLEVSNSTRDDFFLEVLLSLAPYPCSQRDLNKGSRKTYKKSCETISRDHKNRREIRENPNHCVAFSLETEKLNIPKDSLFPHGLVSRVFTFSCALFGLCSMKSRHVLLFGFFAISIDLYSSGLCCFFLPVLLFCSNLPCMP